MLILAVFPNKKSQNQNNLISVIKLIMIKIK